MDLIRLRRQTRDKSIKENGDATVASEPQRGVLLLLRRGEFDQAVVIVKSNLGYAYQGEKLFIELVVVAVVVVEVGEVLCSLTSFFLFCFLNTLRLTCHDCFAFYVEFCVFLFVQCVEIGD